MELTQENYYSAESDALMSNSQWKRWLECPQAAHAQFVSHSYEPAKSKPMAVGSLIDCLLLEPEREGKVLKEFAEFFLGARGELQAAKDSRAIADFVRKQEWFCAILDRCRKQESLQFELDGMKWKCRLDLLDLDAGWVWDLKTTSDLWREEWIPSLGMRGSFIAAWGYARQLSLYREAARQNYERDFNVGIAGIGTGTETPDLALLPWEGEYLWQLDSQIRTIKMAIPMVEGFRQADPAELRRCERCEWCRRTRSELIISYHDPVKI